MKPEIVFVIENKLGGVAYLNKNLINNSSLRHQFKTRVIWVDLGDSRHHRFKDEVFADEVVYFNYSNRENKYAVLKRLHSFFGDKPGAIFCNDGLEMEAIYLFGTKKTVFQMIHDFYNVQLAIKFGSIVDAYISHTKLFADVLQSADPSTIQSFHIPHGVPISILEERKTSDRVRLVFTGRLVEAKGVKDLLEIEKLVSAKGIQTVWTIIGRGPLDEFLKTQWSSKNNVTFVSPDSNEEVMRIMAGHDLFILPTRFEGSPVTVLEALSAGLVPIVSDLPGGIREVISNEVGYRIQVGDVSGFADAIAELNSDKSKLIRMRDSARKLAECTYDIKKTADDYFKSFIHYELLKKQLPRTKKPISIGFRLDQRWLPNAFVKFIRKRLAS